LWRPGPVERKPGAVTDARGSEMTEGQVYDTIADQYRESKWLLFRHFIERYSLMELLGDLRDRTVADLACGEGVYARQFKRRSA